jgi:hypothetical protein
MKRIHKKFTMLAFILFVGVFSFDIGLATKADAQTRNMRVSDRQVERIIRSIEQRSDRFRRSFNAAIDRSFFDGTYSEEIVKEYIKNFEQATNDLRSRFNGRTAVAPDVDNVLNRAAAIDQFMRTYIRQDRVQRDWTLLKGDLSKLANAYNVAFNLNARILPPSVVATQRAYRVSDSQLETLLRRIETRTDNFRSNLERSLDRSVLNNSNREQDIKEYVRDFENTTNELRSKFNGRTSIAVDVETVLVRAARIDDFMKRNLRNNRAVQNNWMNLRADLNTLANYYRTSFNLDDRRNMPAFPSGGVLTGSDAMFTGTYRLNTSQSDNARTVAENATRFIRTSNRSDIYTRLVNRLKAPEMLAAERQGNRVRLASSRSPQVVLEVDNRDHMERYPNGRTSTVRTSFDGNILTVVSNGDRANDFTAVFTPLDSGRRMLVTRRVYAEQLGQPVEVNSYYDRISDSAQFNIYNGANYPAGTTGGTVNNFVVPNNTLLTATLNSNISTRTSREGDRFTMTVRTPSQYEGAVIEGYVSNPGRSGRISGRAEVSLNYQTIRLRNGQTYRFAGLTESVRTASGDDVRVNNEGVVRDDNQTDKTIGRTAIGAGIGALLGAILDGAEGAAIGAAIGAGTGAGSVYIQGRDNLELMNGTEFTIRSGSPR